MNRSLLALLLTGSLLLSLTLPTGASAATESKAFRVFQAKYCKSVRKQERQAAPALLRFNEIFYGGEKEPAELEAAGREYRQVQNIWREWAQRLRGIQAPAEDAHLWRRFGREHRQVIRVGYQLVEALEAADLPRFDRREKRYIHLQIKRNRTWAQLGLYCS